MEVLPNGLTVLLREVHVAPVVEVQVWAKVGSADERPGEEGLAHFHEHMLFKGTERRGVGEVAGEVEGVGGRINAWTSLDATVYHATLPAAQLGAGLDVLADAVQNSVFAPAEVTREIEVVLEEIRRSEDSPHLVLSDAVFAELYQSHPYRAPILGTAESVSRFTSEQLRAFYERWYTAENLMLVVVGDFESDAVLEAARGAFEEARTGGAERGRPVERRQRQLRTTVLHRPFERACLDLSWPVVNLRHLDAPYLDLLGFILGEGESSRLVQRVKERDGLADRIDASSYTPLDPGVFGVTADTEPDCALAVFEAVARESEALRLRPASDRELEKARANFLAMEHWERESVSGLARKIGSYHAIAGNHQHEAAYLEAIRRATPNDLLRVAREWLAPERMTAGVVLPEAAEPGLDHDAIAAALERGISRARRAMARPIARERASDVHSYELDNGVVVHVVPRREVPVVSARVAMLGGLMAETPETSGITSFLAGMWLRGTRNRSAADFAREIESMAADIDGYSGRNSCGLTLEATSDRLLPILDLFAEALLEPALAPDEIERERHETEGALARREDRLGARVFELFAAEHYRGHPYALPVLGNPESVARIDRAALRAHHERLVTPHNTVMSVVGDVDPDDVATEVAQRLNGLAGAAPPLELPEPPAALGIRETELRKDRAQSHLVIGFRGLALDDDDREALEVIGQLLSGQGGRLFLELRDRRSLAYSVSAMNIEGIVPGFFAVYIATAPDKLDAARRGLLEELERVIAEPPGDAELESVKRNLIGNFTIDEQRSAVRAAHVALDARYGLGPDADRHYTERIESISKKDVLRVARRIITLDAYTVAIIRP
jgi:zinc protease